VRPGKGNGLGSLNESPGAGHTLTYYGAGHQPEILIASDGFGGSPECLVGPEPHSTW